MVSKHYSSEVDVWSAARFSFVAACCCSQDILKKKKTYNVEIIHNFTVEVHNATLGKSCLFLVPSSEP
jgi:hypothetical protein